MNNNGKAKYHIDGKGIGTLRHTDEIPEEMKERGFVLGDIYGTDESRSAYSMYACVRSDVVPDELTLIPLIFVNDNYGLIPVQATREFVNPPDYYSEIWKEHDEVCYVQLVPGIHDELILEATG